MPDLELHSSKRGAPLLKKPDEFILHVNQYQGESKQSDNADYKDEVNMFVMLDLVRFS